MLKIKLMVRLTCVLSIPISPLFVYGQDDARAVIEIPHTIQLRSIDGKKVHKVRGGGISALTNRYTVVPGERELKLRYNEIWPENEHDDHEVAKSGWQEITIQARPDGLYRVVHPQQASDEAREFARDPEIIVDTVEPGLELPGPEPDAPASSAVPVTAGDIAPLERLQFWWKQASPSERGRFLNWIVE